MRWFLLSLLTLCISTQTMTAQLEQHQWEHRLILLFAEAPSQTIYQQQMEQLKADSAGLADRDLRIYSFFAQSSQPNMSESAREEIQREYNPREEAFLCILIGKDGGVKARKTNLYPREDIFDLIDSMPMRRAEMRRKKKGGG